MNIAITDWDREAIVANYNWAKRRVVDAQEHAAKLRDELRDYDASKEYQRRSDQIDDIAGNLNIAINQARESTPIPTIASVLKTLREVLDEFDEAPQ